MRIEAAQIVRPRAQEQSKFQCSACGADRGCDCNAPAIEKLAAINEANRKKQKAYRERRASRDAPVDIVAPAKAPSGAKRSMRTRRPSKASNAR
jgi:hypothetical protein